MNYNTNLEAPKNDSTWDAGWNCLDIILYSSYLTHQGEQSSLDKEEHE